MTLTGRKLIHVATVPLQLDYLRGQVGFMKRMGVEVIVACSPGPGLAEFGAAEQIRTIPVPMNRSFSPAEDIVTMVRLYRLFRKEKPAIVHTHAPKAGLLATVAAWCARVPARVFHVHGLPHVSAEGLNRTLLWWSHRVSCAAAKRVAFVSRSLRSVAIADGVCPVEKSQVLHRGSISGIDALGRFNPEKMCRSVRAEFCSRYGIDPKTVIVGYVGRLAREKGMAELAQAWNIVRKAHDSCCLVVAGDPDQRDPLPAEVLEAFRSDPSVRMLGWIDDLPPLYAAMDVLALPSYREGLGLVLLEAAAMLRPSVASDVAGCQDAVRNDVTGTLVPARDASALAGAILRYVCDPALRREHGAAGRAFVLRDFRPEDIWQATFKEYIALLSKAPEHTSHGQLAAALPELSVRRKS
jgi:glycosyltransferase involved in cell wall biosynthesis